MVFHPSLALHPYLSSLSCSSSLLHLLQPLVLKYPMGSRPAPLHLASLCLQGSHLEDFMLLGSLSSLLKYPLFREATLSALGEPFRPVSPCPVLFHFTHALVTVCHPFLLRFPDTSLHSSVASEESLTLSEPRIVRTETGLRETSMQETAASESGHAGVGPDQSRASHTLTRSLFLSSSQPCSLCPGFPVTWCFPPTVAGWNPVEKESAVFPV